MNSFDENWVGGLLGKTDAPPVTKQTEPAPRTQYPYPAPVCDEKQFLRAVATHRMSVLRDEGVFRHLKFARPGDTDCWFELLTWPGRLCISGDMGTYVFSRVPDMFTFFRTALPVPVSPAVALAANFARFAAGLLAAQPAKPALKINPSYWAEKCIAHEGKDGVKAFSPAYFKARLAEWLDDYEASEATRAEVAAEVLVHADDGEARAMSAAMDFKAEDGFIFQDFWETDCTIYTYHFLWCLYAIVWGIRQYDLAAASQPSQQL